MTAFRDTPERETQFQRQAAREWARFDKYDPKLMETDKDDAYGKESSTGAPWAAWARR